MEVTIPTEHTYDGDTTSLNIVYSEEAIAELKEYFSSKRAFLDPRGGFQQSITDTVEWTVGFLTTDPA